MQENNAVSKKKNIQYSFMNISIHKTIKCFTNAVHNTFGKCKRLKVYQTLIKSISILIRVQNLVTCKYKQNIQNTFDDIDTMLKII